MEIKIRVVGHLGRAQPAHRDRHQLHRRRNRDACGDFGPRQLERAPQHDFGEQAKLGPHRVGVEVARQIRDRYTQELLMAESADRVQAAFEVGTRHDQRAQLLVELGQRAPRPRQIGAHQRVDHVGMANENR